VGGQGSLNHTSFLNNNRDFLHLEVKDKDTFGSSTIGSTKIALKDISQTRTDALHEVRAG
jgi:hypothetical protein